MDKKLEKISVTKRDEAAEVVEKIIDSTADEIILSVPRFSKLTDSLSNFHLIMREAELLHKKVIIESVDDKAIELASLAKLESVNPFFTKSRRGISDITHSSRVSARKLETVPPEEDVSSKQTKRPAKSASRRQKSRLPSIRRVVSIGAISAVALGVLFVAMNILPRAEAILTREKSEWIFNDAMIVSLNQAAADLKTNRLPGETLKQEKNLSLSFPASGRKKVEQHASGTIFIFNAYSSDPQRLVVRTRFVAPDGKIFRLKKGIVVPGAKIVDGKIIPSSIDAEVIADQPGEEYNIGVVERFNIPGLKDTPKYSAFYGESKEPMKGGYIGEVGYPNEEDLKLAKSQLRAQLEGAIIAATISQVPGEFKLLETAKVITYGEPIISGDLDQTGNFSIFGETAVTSMVFRETDLLEILNGKMVEKFGPNFEFKEYTLEYGEPRTDFGKGEMRLPVNFKGLAAEKIDTDELKRNLIGKSEKDIKAVIFGVSGLEGAKVSLWPFWVRRVPRDVNKIKLIVD